MKDVFYEDLERIETNPATSTLEISLWIPGKDIIRLGPVKMTERQRLEARLIVADRTNDEVKTSSYLYTRDLIDVLYNIEHGGHEDMFRDSHVQSYIDPAADPAIAKNRKLKEERETATDVCPPETENISVNYG